MGIPSRITDFMEKSDISYSHILHPPEIKAEDMAKKIHCARHEVAKVIAVHLDGRDAVLIIPASDRLDNALIHESLGSKRMELFTEKELSLRFRDCETGAMSVFGNLYGLEIIVSDSLLEDSDIYFNAGTHSDAIRCKMSDFIKITNPRIANISKLHKDNFVCLDLCY